MTTKAKRPAAKPAAKKSAAKHAAPKREQQNGVTRPAEGTTCRAIWDACEAIKAAGQDITFAALSAKLPKVNAATIRTQRQRFRTYQGLSA